MAYPSAYPLAHTGYFPQPLAAYHDRPTHSIHVGAPNVNVDVHTTREHVAHSPEKQVCSYSFYGFARVYSVSLYVLSAMIVIVVIIMSNVQSCWVFPIA